MTSPITNTIVIVTVAPASESSGIDVHGARNRCSRWPRIGVHDRPEYARSIEQLFEELLKLSNSLDDEEARHVRENLTEEELVIFDILTRPAPELSTAERDEVKKVAKDLLVRLRSLLVLNWRQKSAARSSLKLAIEDTLDSGLPRAYTPELYGQKCSALFEHVYERYPERNSGVYAP